MTAQAYGWPDGNVFIWTGTTGTSAVPAYATDTVGRFQWGVDNRQNLTGLYTNTVTGKRVDVDVGGLYCADYLTLQRMASAQTAVHMHLLHNDGLGSAGQYLWSGFINGIELVGREADLYRVRLTYHANIWSAY